VRTHTRNVLVEIRNTQSCHHAINTFFALDPFVLYLKTAYFGEELEMMISFSSSHFYKSVRPYVYVYFYNINLILKIEILYIYYMYVY
jgi:hypothetical protein